MPLKGGDAMEYIWILLILLTLERVLHQIRKILKDFRHKKK